MNTTAKNVTKIALVISVLMLVLWLLLGTGSTIAWFTDVSEPRVNTFVIGEVSIDVSYKDKKGNYVTIDGSTEIFDDEALYEPGYTQVVYTKIENTGDIAFDYRLCVREDGEIVLGVNVYGNTFYLPDYLRYGIIFADTEPELTRELARLGITDNEIPMGVELGKQQFNVFSEQRYDIEPGGIEYAAIVIYMPEEVGNEANFREGQQPKIELGISVLASQSGTIKYFDENGNPDYSKVS